MSDLEVKVAILVLMTSCENWAVDDFHPSVQGLVEKYIFQQPNFLTGDEGRHAALESQVSESMNYGKCTRNRVFDPLDVRLRLVKQSPFHSTTNDSLQTRHPPSH